MVTQACSPSTWEDGAQGGVQGQGQPGLQGEFNKTMKQQKPRTLVQLGGGGMDQQVDT